MKRTLSAVAGLVVSAMLVFGAGLMPFAAQAKCRKDCKEALASTLKACRTPCPKRKPGKACRAACIAAFKADKTTCKKATNPTPPSCGASTTTTTTTTVGCSAPTHTIVDGALTMTPGRFNYNLTLGLPGANSACNTSFPGSHACTLTELQGAPVSDLACVRDTAGNSVTSFWAIDSSAAPLQQCQDDVVGGSGLNWEYATAHTGSRGQKVALTNATGVLGPLQTGVQCNISGNSWVGCCH
jgi:hypothetical protein